MKLNWDWITWFRYMNNIQVFMCWKKEKKKKKEVPSWFFSPDSRGACISIQKAVKKEIEKGGPSDCRHSTPTGQCAIRVRDILFAVFFFSSLCSTLDKPVNVNDKQVERNTLDCNVPVVFSVTKGRGKTHFVPSTKWKRKVSIREIPPKCSGVCDGLRRTAITSPS